MPRLLSEITSNGEAAFPWKLHRVLEESEPCGFNDIVSWQGNRSFKVHDPKNFEKSIMKKFFNQTRYKSFQRQLNIYGFERITVGTDIGSYTHHLLVRGKPNICRFMVRTKVKNKGSKAITDKMGVGMSMSAIASGSRSLVQDPNAMSMSMSLSHSHPMSIAGNRSGCGPPSALMLNAHPSPTIVRSASCPGVHRGFARRGREAITQFRNSQNENPNGITNELFRPDGHGSNSGNMSVNGNKIQSLRIHNTVCDIVDNLRMQSIHNTIEDDFSEELFSTADTFDVESPMPKHRVANVSIDGMSEFHKMNNNSIGIDGFPSLLLCEDNQDDITALGNSNHSRSSSRNNSAKTWSPMDPFPEDEPQQQPHQQMQQLLQQRIQQQQLQQQLPSEDSLKQLQQRQQQECELLQLQIQELQSRLDFVNTQGQPNANVNSSPKSNSGYLCNGVAAIEACDRGTVTPNDEQRMFSQLNPTPIFSPSTDRQQLQLQQQQHYQQQQHQQEQQQHHLNDNNYMRRSISFCAFPSKTYVM